MDPSATPSITMGEQCRLLLEQLLDAVVLVDAETGALLFVNEAAAKMYRRPRESFAGLNISDLVDSSEFGEEPSVTRGGTITEAGLLFETVHVRADGTSFPAEVHARLGDYGGRRAVFGLVRDITVRKQTERRLAETLAELQQVFETAADGMRIIDRDYNVVRANQTLLELAGRQGTPTSGMKCYEMFPGALCDTDGCPLERVLAGEGRIEIEVSKQRADGSIIECILTAQPYVVGGEVIGVVEDFKDISERKKAEDLARHLATHDSLTDLPNRLLFNDRLTVALGQVDRGGPAPSLMFTDVDGFKEVNDTYGHRVGDIVLAAIAQRLKNSVRKTDTVARIGGDEFVLLMTSLHQPEDAARIADAMLAAVRAPIVAEGHVISVTLSIGIALFREGDDADSLLRRADKAMYAVKNRGGDARAFDSEVSDPIADDPAPGTSD